MYCTFIDASILRKGVWNCERRPIPGCIELCHRCADEWIELVELRLAIASSKRGRLFGKCRPPVAEHMFIIISDDETSRAHFLFESLQVKPAWDNTCVEDFCIHISHGPIEVSFRMCQTVLPECPSWIGRCVRMVHAYHLIVNNSWSHVAIKTIRDQNLSFGQILKRP